MRNNSDGLNKGDTQETANPVEIVIWDKEDKGSLFNMVPEAVQRSMSAGEQAYPELFTKDEHDLQKYLVQKSMTPTATDNRLRLKFWMEFDLAKAEGREKMNMVAVCAGVCSRELFYKQYLARATKLAWLVCPPVSYTTKIQEALEFGLEQMRDILAQPHIEYDEHGKVKYFDKDKAKLKITIFKMLDDRKNGTAVQKHAHVHAQLPAPGGKADQKVMNELMLNNSQDELQKKLDDAKKREAEAMHSAIDVTPKHPLAEKPK